MKLADITTDNRYKVEGYNGIAFYFAGHVMDRYMDEYGDVDEEQSGMVYMIMVGDDHKHVIDPEDVAIIDPESYCHVCGQIGCTHDGR